MKKLFFFACILFAFFVVSCNKSDESNLQETKTEAKSRAGSPWCDGNEPLYSFASCVKQQGGLVCLTFRTNPNANVFLTIGIDTSLPPGPGNYGTIISGTSNGFGKSTLCFPPTFGGQFRLVVNTQTESMCRLIANNCPS